MEPFIADFLKNPKVPKPIRCAVLALVCAVIIFIGVVCAVNSPFVWGKIFGIALAVMFCATGIYLCCKIIKGKK